MKPIAETVARHPALGENTCVPWGLELLLKLEGKIKIDAFPLQSAGTWGFGVKEIEELKRDYKLTTVNPNQDAGDFGGLKRLIESNISQGRCTVFTMPSNLFLDHQTKAVIPVCHTYTAVIEDGEMIFITRLWRQEQSYRLSFQQMSDVHHVWNNILKDSPSFRGYLLNTLYSIPGS